MTDLGRAGAVLLRCEHLTVRRGKREVVADVTAELRAGEIVALLGPNGAGKSTLLDALAGALPPVDGRIERNGRVAIALQSPDLARRTVFANVMLALGVVGRASRRAGRARPRGAPRDRRRPPSPATRGDPLGRRAEARAPRPGDRGQARRAAARRAVRRPRRRGPFEPARRRAVRAAVDTRATLVVVHDRAEAWALADRLLILLDGRLVASGPPREVLERPPSAAVARFLGFDGSFEDGHELLLTRPAHVALDPAGPLEARVTRATPLEDGVRLELQLDRGRVYAVAPLPAPRPGDDVRIRIDGGARFPVSEAKSPVTSG